MLTANLIIVTLIGVYLFWIRPILNSRPTFSDLNRKHESVFAAVREKFAGIKQKLSSALVIAASATVTGYDFLAPIVSGVDVTPLTSKVPSWEWPLVLIATTALLQLCRNLADKRHEAELAKAKDSCQPTTRDAEPAFDGNVRQAVVTHDRRVPPRSRRERPGSKLTTELEN